MLGVIPCSWCKTTSVISVSSMFLLCLSQASSPALCSVNLWIRHTMILWCCQKPWGTGLWDALCSPCCQMDSVRPLCSSSSPDSLHYRASARLTAVSELSVNDQTAVESPEAPKINWERTPVRQTHAGPAVLYCVCLEGWTTAPLENMLSLCNRKESREIWITHIRIPLRRKTILRHILKPILDAKYSQQSLGLTCIISWFYKQYMQNSRSLKTCHHLHIGVPVWKYWKLLVFKCPLEASSRSTCQQFWFKTWLQKRRLTSLRLCPPIIQFTASPQLLLSFSLETLQIFLL